MDAKTRPLYGRTFFRVWVRLRVFRGPETPGRHNQFDLISDRFRTLIQAGDHQADFPAGKGQINLVTNPYRIWGVLKVRCDVYFHSQARVGGSPRFNFLISTH